MIVFTFLNCSKIPADMARVDSDDQIFERERSICRKVGPGFPIKQGSRCRIVLMREYELIVPNNGSILPFVDYDPFFPRGILCINYLKTIKECFLGNSILESV